MFVSLLGAFSWFLWKTADKKGKKLIVGSLVAVILLFACYVYYWIAYIGISPGA